MKNIVILGSTGSIGKQALDVVRANRDKFKVVGLAGGENVEALLQQVKEFSPIYVNSPNIKEKSWNNAKVVSLEEMAVVPEADLVLISTVGSVGLVPTLEAIRSKKEVALANKEVLIMAGELVMAEAKKYNVQILPVDSEHNAVWQCLMGDCTFGSGSVSGPVKRIIITASGGAFRDWPVEKLDSVTPEEALAHPTWSMGKKITIDSATLMNKGFEVIEARWLFGMDYDRISVLLHRESIIHAMAEFADGSFKAVLSYPDMHIPIQHALSYPERFGVVWKQLDLENLEKLSFAKMNYGRYPCFNLAMEAAKKEGSYTAVLNAADDVAVHKFLDGKIKFTDIEKIVRKALDEHKPIPHPSIEDVIRIDEEVRNSLK
ncbi:1-deoxy-D-xylulose-5-phosphate reductoisomerase [Candidatus Marsarchaeota archaeon]|jgi:1-deoxy-D-xylulose-5-phosphate reductoisomerase|nr:1-deoxy-D-xylulose-5-phosphate reductoisomerase [Candidatus Marsarchaeota archaeon]